MRKKAYTLMEILIALAIIGIIAMILVRLISAAMPNKDKAAFLRAYLTTKTIVTEMINDKSLYPDEYSRFDNSKYGFRNTDAPSYGYYAIHCPQCVGTNKFPMVFFDKLGFKNPSDYTSLHPSDNVFYDVNGFNITIKNKKGEELGKFQVGMEGNISVTCNTDIINDCTNLIEVRNLENNNNPS